MSITPFSRSEEIDVVEAIPGSESEQPDRGGGGGGGVIEDGEIDPDQLASETADQDTPPKKLAFNSPPRRGGSGVYGAPPPYKQSIDKYGSGDVWPAPAPDMPKIVSLDVKCEKNSMKVYIGFDKAFYGIIFSKGHYSNVHCVHLPAGLGRQSATFEIGIHQCGTSGNTENGLYGYGAESGSGTYFENIIVIQYDPQVRENML